MNRTIQSLLLLAAGVLSLFAAEANCTKVLAQQLPPTNYVFQARLYLLAGKYEKAIRSANAALEQNPDSAVAYLMRAVAYNKLKKYSESIADCNTAITKKVSAKYEAEPYYYRADAMRTLGQYQNAFDDYTQALKLHPNYRAALLGRAWANENLHKDDAAIADYNRAVKFNVATDLAAMTASDEDTAEDLTSNLNPDLENAIRFYDAVLKDKPGDLDALRDRGLVYMHLLKFDEAIHDFNAAVSEKPMSCTDFPGIGSRDFYNAAKPYYEQGNAAYCDIDFDSAINNYCSALQKYPQYGCCWLPLAVLFDSTNKIFNAELCSIHALSYRPDDWQAWQILGRSLYSQFRQNQANTKKLTAAAEALHRSLSLNPPSNASYQVKASLEVVNDSLRIIRNMPSPFEAGATDGMTPAGAM